MKKIGNIEKENITIYTTFFNEKNVLIISSSVKELQQFFKNTHIFNNQYKYTPIYLDIKDLNKENISILKELLSNKKGFILFLKIKEKFYSIEEISEIYTLFDIVIDLDTVNITLKNE